MDCSLPGSSVYRIFQTRILERVAISFSRGSSRQLRDQTCAPALQADLLGPCKVIYSQIPRHGIKRWISLGDHCSVFHKTYRLPFLFALSISPLDYELLGIGVV